MPHQMNEDIFQTKEMEEGIKTIEKNISTIFYILAEYEKLLKLLPSKNLNPVIGSN